MTEEIYSIESVGDLERWHLGTFFSILFFIFSKLQINIIIHIQRLSILIKSFGKQSRIIY